MKKTTFLGVAAVATLSTTITLVAQEAQEASAPSPEVMARMTPGPMHAKLEPLIGSWKMAGKYRMSSDAPWQEWEANVEREWILENHFIKETMSSEWMGQPFEGIGFIGYDNTREEFTMVWVENMSTGTFTTTGRLDGKMLVFEGENSDALTGEKNTWAKSVLDMSADPHPFKGYGKDADGNEFQSMEMTATRQ